MADRKRPGGSDAATGGGPGHHVAWRIAWLILILAGLCLIIALRVAWKAAVLGALALVAAIRRIPPRQARRLLWVALFAAWPFCTALREGGMLPHGFWQSTVEAWIAGAPVAWGLLAIRKRGQQQWVASRGRVGDQIQNGVESRNVTYEPSEQRRELTRRANAIRRDAVARGGFSADGPTEPDGLTGYPALAEQVAANSAKLDALDLMMRAYADGAGLTQPDRKTRHLRVVRDGEAG